VDTITPQTLPQQQQQRRRRQLKGSAEQSLRRRLLGVAADIATGLRGFVAARLGGASRRLQQDTLGAQGALPAASGCGGCCRPHAPPHALNVVHAQTPPSPPF
jgi:hypothetical protein